MSIIFLKLWLIFSPLLVCHIPYAGLIHFKGCDSFYKLILRSKKYFKGIVDLSAVLLQTGRGHSDSP